MAVSVAGAPTIGEAATATSITCNVPTGATSGEVLVAVVTHSAGTAVPDQTGWTTVAKIEASGSSLGSAMFYRRVASEPASYTFTGLTSGRVTAEMVRLAGVDATTALDATAGTVTGGGVASVTTPSVTTVTDGSMMVYDLARQNASADSTVTPATGTTLLIETTGTGRRTLMFSEARPTAGATGTRTWNATDGSALGMVGIAAAFRAGAAPAGSAPTVNAGADATATTGTAFTRTATETTDSPITARAWTIVSGPAGAGTTIGTAAALSWTPSTAGTYVLRYSATNATGTGSDDVTVTASAPTGGGRNAYVQPFASDSIWNTSLGSGAIFESASATKTANLLGSGTWYINAGVYSAPLTFAASTDPMGTVTTPSRVYNHRIPANTRIDAGTDQTMQIIDGQTVYDYWLAAKTSDTAYTAEYGQAVDLLGTGIAKGTRASALPWIGGLIRKEELAGNLIPHALVMAVLGANLKRGYVWPAAAEDGNAATNYTGELPMGTLVGIPPSVDLAALGLSAEGMAVARALQDYGAYVGDQSANKVLYAEPECEGAALNRARTDFSNIIGPLLRVVTNSTADTVGGGGTRRAPLADTPYIPDAGSTVIPTLVHRVVGVPSGTVGRVAVKTTDAASVRLKVGTNTAVTTGIIFGAAATPDANGYAQLTVTGLTAGTRYYYRVAMTPSGGSESLDTAATVGTFRTAPVGESSFSFSFGSCTNATDSAAMAAIAARGDDLFFHLGDLYYADGSGTGLSNFRSKMDAKITAPNHAAVFATTPTVYTPSDHDGMNNDTNAGMDSTAWANWNTAFRERFPTPTLPGANGCYYTFAWGRVRFIVMDRRSFATNPAGVDNATKTCLGATQKQWLKDTIAGASEPVVVIAQDSPWISAGEAGEDGWSGYTTERTELANFFAASGKNIVMLAGDMHALAADNGTNAPGGIALFHAAPFNTTASQKGGPYTTGPYPTSGSVVQQYGRCVVIDDGSNIALAFTGYSSDNTARVSLTKTYTVASDPGTPPESGRVTDRWTGSALVRLRVDRWNGTALVGQTLE